MKVIASSFIEPLLQRAIDAYHIDSSQLEIVHSSELHQRHLSSAPAFMIVQPGGVAALEELGVSKESVLERGFAIEGIELYSQDVRSKTFFSYQSDGKSLYPAINIRPEELRRLVDIPVQFSTVNEPLIHHGQWAESFESPGVLLRVVQGELKSPRRGIVVDGEKANIGVGQVAADTLLFYAVPKIKYMGDYAKRYATEEIDRYGDFFASRAQYLREIAQDNWFDINKIGYRSCASEDMVFLGNESLRLHPITGQHMSHWARVVVALAKHVDAGASEKECIEMIDSMNRVLFRQHKRTVYFYLQPHMAWRLIYRPHTTLLRHIGMLRARAVRELGLL